MEFKIQLGGNVYSVCLGYKTDWFDSMSFLTIIQLYYENKQVVHAEVLYHS